MKIAYRDGLIGVGYVGAYVALDGFSFVQPLLKLGITPWNPDAGLTLAFLLTRGWRQAPWAVAAALSAELLVRDAPAPIAALICASIIIGGGYGILAFTLSRRGVDRLLASRRAALEFSVGAAATALIVASGYAATLVIAGSLPMTSAGEAIARNWVGDLNGVLTLTPLLLAASEAARVLVALRAHLTLVLAQASVLIGLMLLLFRIRPMGDLPLAYVLFAPVIWITLTWGVVGASMATLVIQVGLISAAASPNLSGSSLIEIQYFLVTLALTSLLLGAVLAERAHALARVATGEAEQRALLAAAPDAVLSTNLQGNITSANLAAQDLLRAEDSSIVGTSLVRWLPELVLKDPMERRRLTGVRAGGERFPAEVACVRLEPPARPGYLLIARDMTKHDFAQTQLRERDMALSRAMRFALAGELATALTHELNQPITALVSYLKAVEILAGPAAIRHDQLHETIHKATREALRASDIIKRLRDFYQGGSIHMSATNVQALVGEVTTSFAERVARLGAEITHDIRLVEDVVTDKIQLQMVLHNLLANALDALEDIDGKRWVHIAAATQNGRLLASVEDSGRGVLRDIRGQLFEPFVTHKSDGMGLGLAISRSLLRSQGGELKLDATGADGARFLIDIPIEVTELHHVGSDSISDR